MRESSLESVDDYVRYVNEVMADTHKGDSIFLAMAAQRAQVWATLALTAEVRLLRDAVDDLRKDHLP